MALECAAVHPSDFGMISGTYGKKRELPAVAGRIEAYLYLIESIRAFPDQETFAQALRDAGLAEVSYRNFSFGIAAAHFARKPA